MPVTKRLAVNVFSLIWRAVMSIALIPLYISYLGIDALSLIGLFALVQAWLVVLDLGILSEMTRPTDQCEEISHAWSNPSKGDLGHTHSANHASIIEACFDETKDGNEGNHSTALQLYGLAYEGRYFRDCLRKHEIVLACIAVAFMLAVWASSGWLATEWAACDSLMAINLPVKAIADAMMILGMVAVLQLFESVYASNLIVLKKQPLKRSISIVLSTIRGLGAVGVLIWVSPNVEAFFIWQGVVSLVTVVLFAALVYSNLPPVQHFVHSPSLKKNVVANYVGQGWRALMSMAFIPLYIRYLGIESYGLIGVFAILQAWLGLLDMGMRPALGREMARFTGGAHDAQAIRNLLRSIEMIGFAIAISVAMGIWATSGWLASNWLRATNLPVEAVAQAFAVMGVVTALQFIESIYASCIAGLQRQVLQNIVTSVMGTARGLGAVGILIWISPTIEAFFIWQGIISLVNVALFSMVVYRILPRSPNPSGFSLVALLAISRFAGGTMAITILALLLMQTDKLLLSRLLPLESFAHYSLAGVVTNTLYLLVGPIGSAFYPRFSELVTRGDELALQTAYHQGAQLVTVTMGSAALVLIFFGERVLRLWTMDPILASQVAPLVAVLALGTLCNGLMWMPYQMQLAHGWTSLTIRVNCVAVAILVPAILYVVPKYGPLGAAWIWVGLNTSYLVFSIYFMHQRLLPTEKWKWYWQDVFIPLISATAIAELLRWLMPDGLGRLAEFSLLILISGSVLLAAVLAASIVRQNVASYVQLNH